MISNLPVKFNALGFFGINCSRTAESLVTDTSDRSSSGKLSITLCFRSGIDMARGVVAAPWRLESAAASILVQVHTKISQIG